MAAVLASFFFAVALSLAAVALLIRLAHKKAWYDRKSERKIHEGDIPRIGGIGIGFAFFVVFFTASLITGENDINGRFWAAVFALLVIILSGIWDDFKAMPPRRKILFQTVAALFVIIPGYVFSRVSYVEACFVSDLQWFLVPVTILWFVGITNAVNLIDGIDGLAGGLSALIALFFGLVFLNAGSSLPLLYSVSLLGVILGFMVFNAPLPKARIFMGDSGSQFLGFSLALLPLMGNSPLPVLYAAALLAIPIFDTTAAVWRRIRDRKKIYLPDKSHIHHKLLNLGLGVKGVNAVLYSLQIVLGVLTLLAIRSEGSVSLYFLGTAYFAVIAFFAAVHFLNRNKQKNASQQ